jgi:DNA modification methylase
MISETFNIDCIEGMKQYPDKYFDLAVVDPPYGIKRFEEFKIQFEQEIGTEKILKNQHRLF